MGKIRDKIFPKRLLYIQLLFTVIAFLAMAVLSYAFMSNIVHGYLIQNAHSVLDFVQSQTTLELLEPQARLDAFSRVIRSMVMDGDSADEIEGFFYQLTDSSGTASSDDGQYATSHSGFFGYFETVEGKPFFISSSQWSFPEDIDPTERLWYTKAVAARGRIVETLAYNDIFSGNTMLLHSMAFFDNEGRRLGVVGQRISMEIIGRNVVEAALASGGYGMLISDDMVLLVHPDPDFRGRSVSDPSVPAHIFLEELLAGAEIFERPMISFRGEDSVAFFRKLPNNWYIGLVTPKDHYYKNATNMAMILGILAAVFSVIMVYILIRLDIARNKSDMESRYKSSFLANMSHEIRTPMNAILGITEIQLENKELPPETIEALGKIYNSGDLLLGIINDILDLSKIEAGRLEILPAKYDVASLINDTVHLNRIRFESKPIDFNLLVSENVPSLLIGDELRIKQILNNLLSNAFKYTRKGKVELLIDVEACPPESASDKVLSDVMLILRVKDTGLGMTNSQISKLFDRFTRFNTDSNRIIEGTGLGMSITWNLVQMMKGNITVESKPGAGSEFTIHLRQGNTGANKLGREVVDNLQQFSLVFAAQKKRTQILREPMPYGKVLIVDDTESNLYVTRGLMINYRLDIETVSSGFEAIEKIKNGAVYDIVFMDHMMPIMDGMEAVKIIRNIGYKEPIVALTANAVAGQAEVFLANGFDAFVSKPIDIRLFNALLNKMIRDKQSPDVIEAARQKYGFFKQDSSILHQNDHSLIKPFLNDAEKALKVLEPLLADEALDNNENLHTYIINMHAIKSALENFGEIELSNIARRLEQAGRDRSIDAILEATPEFLKMLETMVEKCRSIKYNEDNPASGKYSDDINGSTQVYLHEKLLALMEACRGFDNKTAEAILEDLQKMAWPPVTRETLDNISGCLLHSDFDEAIGIIERYIE